MSDPPSSSLFLPILGRWVESRNRFLLLVAGCLLLGSPTKVSADEQFFREALAELPPRFLADIPLAKRKRLLELAEKSSSRLDTAEGWLHWYSDGARIGATSMIWAKVLPRPDRTPLLFVHLPKPFADGKKPRLGQTFVLEKRKGGWVEVTEEIMPDGLDLTLHFRTRREDTVVEVANWKEIERADGRGTAWVFGDRVKDLHWSGERFLVEPAASPNLTRN